MRDVFVEYLVKRRTTPLRALAKVGVVAGTIILALAFVLFSGLFGDLSALAAMAAIGVAIGGYYLLTGMNIEYEYIVTNGEMDVDKVIAQRRRKRLLTINFREAEAFGKYNPAEHTQKTYQTRLLACDADTSPDLWFVTLRVKDKGQTLLVFNGNERVLEAIKPFLPRPLFHAAFNRVQG